MEVPEILPNDEKPIHDLTPWDISQPVQSEAVFISSLPSYDDFFHQIFLKNQLCILGPNATESWRSRKLWVNDAGNPDFEFLSQNFGHVTAPITNCNASPEDGCNTKTEMLVSDFIDYWKKHTSESQPSREQSLYLKDWHFNRAFPSFHAYTPPSVLCSDWLNEFCDVRQDGDKGDDYRFVYMGPRDSWTPFHSDVLRSYSWSANICGRKKWLFFPPGEEEKLKDRFGQLTVDLTDPSLQDADRYPHARGVVDGAVVVIQHPGEIVFVPSGWHHQVFNLEDTISINHNWVNGASAHLTWNFLKSQLTNVQSEIADCSDMDGFHSQCQKILKADSGMDYIEFYNFIVTIAMNRIVALEAFCSVFDQSQLEERNGDVLIHAGEGVESSSAVTDTVTPHISDKPDSDDVSVLCLWTAAFAVASSRRPCHSRSLLSGKTGLDSDISPSPTDIVIASPSRCRSESGHSLSQSRCNTSDARMSDSASCQNHQVREDFDSCLTSGHQDCQGQSHIKDFPSGHRNCPHWAHCGPRLAIFDLRRCLAILEDVTGQVEWSAILSESDESGRTLLQAWDTLKTDIENICQHVLSLACFGVKKS